eukprot:1647744-Prymnesium_polylepis.1
MASSAVEALRHLPMPRDELRRRRGVVRHGARQAQPVITIASGLQQPRVREGGGDVDQPDALGLFWIDSEHLIPRPVV